MFVVYKNGNKVNRVKKAILQWNYRKMTIPQKCSYNSFVKFHGKKNWEPQHDYVVSKSML